MHCKGIGLKTQSKLISSGFETWDDCLNNPGDIPFQGEKLDLFLQTLSHSKDALAKNDINYFIKRFPTREHWRILNKYFYEATFFDIETTGLNWSYNHATVISTYKQNKVQSFIYPDTINDFIEFAEDSKLLVSFNGNAFDVPFLERTFNIPDLGCPHVDLRWIAYHIGFKNGLKEIEKEMNIKRPDGYEDITGYDAILLYQRSCLGDKAAKERLIKYCEIDAVSTYIVSAKILNKHGIEQLNINDEIFDLLIK